MLLTRHIDAMREDEVGSHQHVRIRRIPGVADAQVRIAYFLSAQFEIGEWCYPGFHPL